MVTMLDPFEVDLPGELHDEAEVIPFPGTWKPDPEPNAACALCDELGAEVDTGLCNGCAPNGWTPAPPRGPC